MRSGDDDKRAKVDERVCESGREEKETRKTKVKTRCSDFVRFAGALPN